MDFLGDRGVDPTRGADDWDDGRIDGAGGTGVVPGADRVIPVFLKGVRTAVCNNYCGAGSVQRSVLARGRAAAR